MQKQILNSVSKLLVLLIFTFLSSSSAYSQADTPTSPQEYYCPNLTLTLLRGDSDQTKNNEVSKLQKFLKVNLDLNDTQFLVTGYFGNITKNYVKQFQREQNLVVTGIVGRVTRDRMALVCNPNDDAPVTNNNNNTYNNNLPCNINGTTIPHNSTLQGYLSNTVYSPNTCSTTTFTCNNGNVTPSPYYSTCSVLNTNNNNNANNNAQSCIFNNLNIPHGQSILAYSTSQVTSPNTCLSQTRTCNNATLSGSYTYSSCSQIASTPMPTPTPTYSWNTGEWSTCSNGQQTRGVQCKDNNNNVVADTNCTAVRPNTSQSCTVATNGSFDSCYYNGSQIAHGQSITHQMNPNQAGNDQLLCENRLWYRTSTAVPTSADYAEILRRYELCSTYVVRYFNVSTIFGCTTNGNLSNGEKGKDLSALGVRPNFGDTGTIIKSFVSSAEYSQYLIPCRSYTIDWGDGTVESMPRTVSNCVTSFPYGRENTHQYRSAGNYTVTVTIENGVKLTKNVRII